MEFVNIDRLTKDNFRVHRQVSKAKSDNYQVIYESTDGIVSVKEVNNNQVEERMPEIFNTINTNPVKTFESYRVKKTDTIKNLVDYALGKYANLRKYYNQTQLMNEIIRENWLFKGDVDLQNRDYIKIPYYIEPKVEYLEDVSDYIDYEVTVGTQFYYLIVLKMYGITDPDEVENLVKELEIINGRSNPTVGSVIKIPNPEKYFEEKNNARMGKVV